MHANLDPNYSPDPAREPSPFADASFNRASLSSALGPAVEPSWKIREINNTRAFNAFVKRLEKEQIFSVDTETWGPEGERLDRDLCLIQIGIPRKENGRPTDQGQVVLIDVVALEEAAAAQSKKSGTAVNPLAALKKVLEAKGVTKVVHHAQFESDQFAKYGIKLNGIVDTEKFAREMRPDLYSYSLKACCLEVLDAVISKDEQKSDWHRRPLSREQVAYAALDAEWTMRLYNKLTAQEEKLAVRPTATVDELMAEIISAAAKRMELLRQAGVGNDYALEEVRMERLKEAIKEKLAEKLGPGEKAIDHSGPHGSAKAGRRAITEINIAKLKQEFPDIASEVVFETAKLKDITDQLKARGFDTQQIEDVMSRLKDLVGYSKPSAEVWPKFSRIYTPDTPAAE
jgi:microsomal dipeptidase-like Zn-dependent dipeptidase